MYTHMDPVAVNLFILLILSVVILIAILMVIKCLLVKEWKLGVLYTVIAIASVVILYADPFMGSN